MSVDPNDKLRALDAYMAGRAAEVRALAAALRWCEEGPLTRHDHRYDNAKKARDAGL